MGSLASLIGTGVLVGGLAFDMTLNAVQDWFQVFYADAFWSTRVKDAPAVRALAGEEAEINRLLAASDFSAQRVVITDPPRR